MEYCTAPNLDEDMIVTISVYQEHKSWAIVRKAVEFASAKLFC